MHAAGAFFVIDFQGVAFHPHAFGGAQIDDFFLNIERAPVAAGMGAGIGFEFTADICLNRFLIDADIVPPGADKGHIGPGDGGHAAVGAAVEFEFEFVGESRAMKFVLIILGQSVAKILGIIAGIFATCLTDAVGRSPQVGTGAAQILIKLVGQLIENFFQAEASWYPEK